MIKAIIFDFDGTLIELVDAHYEALNQAIEEIAGIQYIITQEEQNTYYNGLSTSTKLDKLVKDKKLSIKLVDAIKARKQDKTIQYILRFIKTDRKLYHTLLTIKSEGYKLYVASNALLETVKVGLIQLGIIDLFDDIIGNDHIINKKPHSEIFLKTFIQAQCDPHECLIVEDSRYGIEAAVKSGAHVLTVNSPKDITYDYISQHLTVKNDYKYKDSKLNIVIPMAGSGKRFAEAGYKLPKPLIDVNGQPMIKTVIDNLAIDANYIFIIQKEHAEKHHLDLMLKLMVPNCKIVYADGLTGGACETVLLAEKLIDNDNNLLIANCDQYVKWDSATFLSNAKSSNIDGAILTFKANETKWSYAKADKNGFVMEVAEKKVISEHATVGIYWWKKGTEFVKYATQMIKANDRTNNEFYVVPSFNWMIKDKKQITIHNIDTNDFCGLGTPEDLTYFLNNYKD